MQAPRLTVWWAFAVAVGLGALPAAADSADALVAEREASFRRYPTSPSWAAAYAVALAGAGRWTQALALGERVLADPSLSDSWRESLLSACGDSLVALGRWDDAARVFRLASQGSGPRVLQARNQLVGIAEWRTWTAVQSRFFVLLFPPTSPVLTAGQQDLFAYRADLAYLSAAKALNASLNSRIFYFVYASREDLTRVTAMATAHAEPSRYRIHATGSAPIPHEVVHVVAGHSIPDVVRTAAFSEGFADYLGWLGANAHDRAVGHATPEILQTLMMAPSSRELSLIGPGYQLSASFVGHVLETYRWPQARAFLEGCTANPDAAAQRFLRCTFPELARTWAARVARSGELRQEVQRALPLPAEAATEGLRRLWVEDDQRLDTALHLGQVLADREVWAEAAVPLDRAATLVGLRGWSYPAVAQLGADRAYVKAQLGRWDEAVASATLAARIDGDVAVTRWATAVLSELADRRLPAAPPPRVVGRSWR